MQKIVTRKHCFSIEHKLLEIFSTPFLLAISSKTSEPLVCLSNFFLWFLIEFVHNWFLSLLETFKDYYAIRVCVLCHANSWRYNLWTDYIHLYFAIPVNSTANKGNISFEEFLILHIRSFKLELGLRIFPSHVFYFWQQRKDIMASEGLCLTASFLHNYQLRSTAPSQTGSNKGFGPKHSSFIF